MSSLEWIVKLFQHIGVFWKNKPYCYIHHFISKSQSSYLNATKMSLKHDECIVIGDFAENYNFLVQDAVQAFHWDNTQATLHPFMCYYKGNENKIENLSAVVISNCMKHNAITFYLFKKNT